MTDEEPRRLAHRICRALFPEADADGIAQVIREEILVEALRQRPAPESVCELRAAVERIGLRRGSAAVDLVAALNSACRRAPSRRLGELVSCGSDRH